MKKQYDCIVIGAGHAGIEAALAASRMGCSTLMVTLFFETIGQMSCNPAIGGVGKGQLVKEIDALGGEMGLAADKTGLQFRRLNASKGAAVHSSRCQSDKKQYKLYMQDVVRHQTNLDVWEDKVEDLVVCQGKIVGIKTQKREEVFASTVVITSGTFLKGRIHVGKEITPGGRVNEPNAVRLADCLENLGFQTHCFKTGTPPRLDGTTINFQGLTVQHSDNPPSPFSFRTECIAATQKLLPCYITQTNACTHDIIQANIHLSPMYSGQIQATGVRYCPSIEDKLKKFSGRPSHQIFLEPEGLDTSQYYPNGISTGLPVDVQEQFVHSIKGLEQVKIICPGYSIEYVVVPSTELKATLETKRVAGLFLAGQINGTTGYEEAAAQGLMAGINAALKIQNKEPFVLSRNEAYIGVLIDDLVTKGTDEPYRMFTSRVEYRLTIREDNADQRLFKYGQKFGLLKEKDVQKFKEKYVIIHKEIQALKNIRVHPGKEIDRAFKQCNSTPLRQATLLSDLLKRPEINYSIIAPFNGKDKQFPPDMIRKIEYEIKYEGFINRQSKDIEKFRHIEYIRIPEDIVYKDIPGLSIEVCQKLKHFTPANLGQANRIAGITPAAISVLMVYLRKKSAIKK